MNYVATGPRVSPAGYEADFLDWYQLPMSRHIEQCEQQVKFARLVRDWKRSTMFMSSQRDMTLDPSYQRIIGMGTAAIPLLLEELMYDPDHYFVALSTISGVNPVPPAYAGNFDKMAQGWIAWGANRGYVR